MKSALAWVFMLGASAGASAQQSVEDYRYFMRYGILDPGVSDETANALVREGIASEDSEIRELTIRALGIYVVHVVHDMPTGGPGPTPGRAFSVPDLKSFPIGYWREQHRLSGYNTAAASASNVALRAQAHPDDASPEEDFKNYLATFPVWIAIPKILCALYPGDGEVLDLVWEQKNVDVSVPSTSIATLMLLNLGGFVTPEANAFRIGVLVAPGSVLGPDFGAGRAHALSSLDAAAVSLAAEGLALSRPVEAVPHLVSAALKHPEASGDVLVALAGYGDEVLSDHASEVAGMLGEIPSSARPPMGAVADAVSRLGAFDRRQRDAEPRGAEVVVE